MFGFTVENVRAQARARQRVMIQPRVVVQAKTEDQRRVISDTAKKVIEEHRAVLEALKNR